MLVVCNICAKDWALAADNLEWARKLDGGKVDYDCLLCHDTSLEQHSIDTVEASAREYFRAVELFCYDPPSEPNWPMAPNHAFQSIALHLGVHLKTHWFWWEADVTPLVPHWLHSLDVAYRAGKRPFAGHIVPEMGHMNGVAVYPPMIAKYSPKSLYCRSASWDVVMKEDIMPLVTPLNHLICHYPRATEVKCQVKDPAVPQKMQQMGFVIFHGCNDGSMLKVLRGEKPFDYGIHPSVKILTVEDIGRRVDESEALWFREAIRLHKVGRSIIPYEECRKPMPKIEDQAKANGWTGGIIDLPVDDGLGHLNSGLCEDDKGQLWLVTRRWQRREHMERSWLSTLHAYKLLDRDGELDTRWKPIELKVTNDPFDQAEDPRVIFKEGRFYVSYCQWSQRSSYHARQVFAEFDRDWKFKKALKIPYGSNNFKSADIHTKVAEKNWLFFWHNETWHFVYSASPHVVVEIKKKRLIEHKTENDLPWRYGDIRGGTPPVQIGGEFFSFGHSSLPWRKRQKRYYMLCYAFEAQAPFKITRITEQPLLAGSELDSRINRAPLTAFACGSVFQDGQWLVTGGCNDECTFFCRIPHDDLLKRMTTI